MDKIDCIYFINLERRTDRKIHFIEQCLREHIPTEKICRIQAIDGITHPFSRLELSMFSKADFLLNPDPIVKKIIGNQLSHYYLLKEIVRSGEKIVIVFQDDAVLIPNFINHIENIVSNIPEDAELINIGLHKVADGYVFEGWDFATKGDDFEKIGSQRINPFICKMNNDINPCSLAYIITLEGAKKIIQHFDSVGFTKSTDFNFNDYLINKDIFYSSNTVLVTGNANFKSDVFCL